MAQQQDLEAKRHTERLRKAGQVHQMRLEGLPLHVIAKRLKITAEDCVIMHKEHIDSLRQLEALGAAEAARRVQDDRYEALLSSVWSDALGGDLAAVKECRMILDSITAREAKVTAMITKDDAGNSTATLIAEGATEDYIEALRRMR